MKIIWKQSDTWARGVFAHKTNRSTKISGAIDSFSNAISTFNPFGNTVKLPKKLPSDEFLTFKYPKKNLIDKILKNL